MDCEKDPLWQALDELLVRLEDSPRCIVDSDINWDGGLNAETINRLARESGFSAEPLIWQEGENGRDPDVYRFFARPDRPPIKWYSWSNQCAKLWPYEAKLRQTVAAVRTWRDKHKEQLSAKGNSGEPDEFLAVTPGIPKATVNTRMLEAIQERLQEVGGWTAAQWAGYLKCARSTVVATATWQDLTMARERLKAERAKSHRRKPKASNQRRD